MALANDSILVTPGSGATVATHAAGGKEHQVVMLADPAGQLLGSKPLYLIDIAPTVHVAAASTTMWDLWNGDGALVVRVVSILQRPDVVTAVTGVATNWALRRTTSVGTGGTTQTAVLPDTTQTALDADITCRLKPTGGAALGDTLRTYSINSEETNAGTIILASLGGLELVPPVLRDPVFGAPGIRLGPSQGLAVVQTTNSAQGNTGWTIAFTVE